MIIFTSSSPSELPEVTSRSRYVPGDADTKALLTARVSRRGEHAGRGIKWKMSPALQNPATSDEVFSSRKFVHTRAPS